MAGPSEQAQEFLLKYGLAGQSAQPSDSSADPRVQKKIGVFDRILADPKVPEASKVFVRRQLADWGQPGSSVTPSTSPSGPEAAAQETTGAPQPTGQAEQFLSKYGLKIPADPAAPEPWIEPRLLKLPPPDVTTTAEPNLEQLAQIPGAAGAEPPTLPVPSQASQPETTTQEAAGQPTQPLWLQSHLNRQEAQAGATEMGLAPTTGPTMRALSAPTPTEQMPAYEGPPTPFREYPGMITGSIAKGATAGFGGIAGLAGMAAKGMSVTPQQTEIGEKLIEFGQGPRPQTPEPSGALAKRANHRRRRR